MSDDQTGQTEGRTETPEASVEAPATPPKRKGGRPRKSRGAGNSSDEAKARWTVRGIPTNVRDMAVNAAENRGMTVGDWIAEAIVKHSRADKNGVSADEKTNLPAVDIPSDLPDLLATLDKRLTELEKRKQTSLFGRLFGRHTVAGLLVLLMGTIATVAHSQTWTFPAHFLSAGEFLEETEAGRQRYAIGWVDAFGSSMLAPNIVYGQWQVISVCIQGWDSRQLAAVIAKHIEEHPEFWNAPSSGEIFNALLDVCPS